MAACYTVFASFLQIAGVTSPHNDLTSFCTKSTLFSHVASVTPSYSNVPRVFSNVPSLNTDVASLNTDATSFLNACVISLVMYFIG